MTELVLVRHGETVWHHDNRYTGRSDVALTSRGHQQAAALARWAGSAGLDAVVTSPLSRARDTAVPAAETAEVPLQVDERLVEVDFGEGDGCTRDEMREAFPDALEAFRRRPASHPLPGGEPGGDAVARATPVLAEAAQAHPDGRALVVAHQTLLRLLLCSLLEIPLDRYRAVFPRLDNVAPTIIRLTENEPPALLALNIPISPVT